MRPRSPSSGHTARPKRLAIQPPGSTISSIILLVLAAIVLIFGLREPSFFSPRNFVNLILQMAGVLATAIGVVFVLLIAEIDLSIAYVGAVGSVSMTLLLREGFTDWPWWAAIAVALLITALIGLLHGVIITKTRAPSFMVTLAALLIWSGVVSIMTTQFSVSGTIPIQDPVVIGIANSYFPPFWSWVIWAVSMILYTLARWESRQTALHQNLDVLPPGMYILQVLLVGLVAASAIAYANLDRGMPVIALLLLVLLVFWSLVASGTRFGRYVYAVGGNAEAARRAGIDVGRVRMIVFMISGLMSGVGGIILASRLRSVDTNTGGTNLLLSAIAAAVIGGTSLFGGRGRVQDALLGALLIASIDNGMGLLGLPPGTKLVINGVVLLLAVVGDALNRFTEDTTM